MTVKKLVTVDNLGAEFELNQAKQKVEVKVDGTTIVKSEAGVLSAVLTEGEAPDVGSDISMSGIVGASGYIMGEPAKWVEVTLNGTQYVMPLYEKPFKGIMLRTVPNASKFRVTNLEGKNIVIDWGDGTTGGKYTNSHTYRTPGEYLITITFDELTVFSLEGEANLLEVLKFSGTSVTKFSPMFRNCTNLTSVQAMDTSNGTDFSYMFNGCANLIYVPDLDTSKGTKFYRMFEGCTSLTSAPLFDTSNSTGFDRMFYGCTKLTSVPLFDTSNSTSFSQTFYGCTSLMSVPLFDTSNSTTFWRMFYECRNLASVPALDMPNGTDFDQMFDGCRRLTKVDITGYTKGIDVSPTALSGANLAAFINQSGAPNPVPQTIKLSSNQAASITAADIAPAIARGWKTHPVVN